MTDEERKLALYCLKASSDYHSEVCEECINYPNCDHTGQDDVTETIIKALEQEPKRGHWIPRTYIGRGTIQMYVCSNCRQEFGYDAETGIEFVDYNYCPNCGAEMKGDE